jgi:hypothetical protein
MRSSTCHSRTCIRTAAGASLKRAWRSRFKRICLSSVPITAVDVRLHVFAGAMGDSTFCSDVGMPGQIEQTWRATRGAVAIELSAPGVDTRSPHLDRATVRITNGRFVNAEGVTIDQQQPVTVTALVGLEF